MKHFNIKKKNQIYLFLVFLIFFSFFYVCYIHEFDLITQDYQRNPSRIELELIQDPVKKIFLTENDVSTSLNQIENDLHNLIPKFVQIGDNIHWYPHFSWNSTDEADFFTSYRGHYNFQFISFPQNQFFKNRTSEILNGIELVEGSSPTHSNDIVVDLQFKRQGFKLGENLSFAYYMNKNFTIREIIQDRIGATPLNSSKFLGNYCFNISGFYQITDDRDLKSLVEYNKEGHTSSNNSIGSYSNDYRNYYNYIFSTNDIAFSILKNNLSNIVMKDQFDIPFIQKVIFTRPNNNEKISFQQLSDNIKTIQNWIINSPDATFNFNEKHIEDLKGKIGLFWKNIQNLKNLQMDIFIFLIPIYISLSVIIFLIEKDSIKFAYVEYKKRYLLGEKPKEFFKDLIIDKSKITILQTFVILLLNTFLQTSLIYSDLLKESLKLNLVVYFIIISLIPILIDIILLELKFKKAKKESEQFDLHFNEESREIKEKLKFYWKNLGFVYLIILSLIPIISILNQFWMDYTSPTLPIYMSIFLMISFLLIFIISLPLSKILLNVISIILEKVKIRIKKSEKSLKKLLVLPQMSSYLHDNKGVILLIFLLVNILLSGFYLYFEQTLFTEKQLLKWDSSTIKLELRYDDEFDYDSFINSNILSISGIKSEYFTKLILGVNSPDYTGNSGVFLNSEIFDPFLYSQFIDYSEKIQISGNKPLDFAQPNKTYNNSIIISKALADKLELNIGDMMRIKCQSESLESFKISGIIERAPLCEIDAIPLKFHIIFPNNLNKTFKQYVQDIDIYLKTEPDFNFQNFSKLFLNQFKQLVKNIEIKNNDLSSEDFNSQFLPRLFLYESFLIGISLLICSLFLIQNFYEDQEENHQILKFLGCPRKETKKIIMAKMIIYFGIILFISSICFLLLSFLFYKILMLKTLIQIDLSFYKSWDQITRHFYSSYNWDLWGFYGKFIIVPYKIPTFSIILFLVYCLFLIIVSQIKYSVNENEKANIIKSRNG
ncbi:MAG: hypothetical protein ACTSWL_06540 [Promethearchaeota archaeon]